MPAAQEEAEEEIYEEVSLPWRLLAWESPSSQAGVPTGPVREQVGHTGGAL